MPKAKAVKKKTGRPSKYKEEYCELLIRHMAEGLSLEAFAGVVKVNQDTIHEWVKKHPAFSEAKSVGIGLARLFWEKVARNIAVGKIQGASAAVAIFCLKNRLGWRDKQPDEVKDSGFKPVIIELPNKGKTLQIQNEKK
jgi:hypothetical protein